MNKLVLWLLSIMLLLLTACSLPLVSGYGANGMSREEFTDYVENVFKLQNNLTRQLMMLMEGDEANKLYASLLLAEQNMHKSCRSLNEYAARINEDQRIGLFLQRDVEKNAENCERYAKALQALLANFQ